MRLSTIKVLLLVFALLAPMALRAQIVTGSHGEWRYSGWERLKPKNAMVQYAGGMGMMSFGAGWEYGKRGMWNTDVLVGFLPAVIPTIFALHLHLSRPALRGASLSAKALPLSHLQRGYMSQQSVAMNFGEKSRENIPTTIIISVRRCAFRCFSDKG